MNAFDNKELEEVVKVEEVLKVVKKVVKKKVIKKEVEEKEKKERGKVYIASMNLRGSR